MTLPRPFAPFLFAGLMAVAGVALAQDAAASAPVVVQKVEKAVVHGAQVAASGIERGAKAAARGIERGVKAAGKGVKRGAEATARAADKVVGKVGGSASSAPASTD